MLEPTEISISSSNNDETDPPSSTFTVQNIYDFDKEDSSYGCLKCTPSQFHTEIRRPKAPFNPRAFDWSDGHSSLPLAAYHFSDECWGQYFV